MNVIEIVRLEESETGTIGVLKFNKEVLCYTLEESDNLNKVDVSSVPAQQYIIERYDSQRFGRPLFRLRNVPGRTSICIHAGNTEDDTAGCILLGKQIDGSKGKKWLLYSLDALDEFMGHLHHVNEAHLTITEKY